MAKKIQPFPKPATGWVGFGCAFILCVVGFFVLAHPETRLGVAGVVAGALVAGGLTARFGEPFFEKLLSLFTWFR